VKVEIQDPTRWNLTGCSMTALQPALSLSAATIGSMRDHSRQQECHTRFKTCCHFIIFIYLKLFVSEIA